MGWIGEGEDGQWWKKVPVLLLSRKSASLLSLGLACRPLGQKNRTLGAVVTEENRVRGQDWALQGSVGGQ